MISKPARELRPGDRVIRAFDVRTVFAVEVDDETIEGDGWWTSRWPGVTVHWDDGTASRIRLNADVDTEVGP